MLALQFTAAAERRSLVDHSPEARKSDLEEAVALLTGHTK
jgi:hypothetical protein